ncbi:hypothetical protein CALCODRAFT_183610 [Calocera cornea HHB12733]|uniref:Uncharacterized protein n=1 Tax=Calocera cornea HHB12733 TaxID=1353952 RepID=A0A165CAU1_9BASI|nr:hypothetical protein CALCODRAFT_183610 [Calocera cornea HHB12733]
MRLDVDSQPPTAEDPYRRYPRSWATPAQGVENFHLLLRCVGERAASRGFRVAVRHIPFSQKQALTQPPEHPPNPTPRQRRTAACAASTAICGIVPLSWAATPQLLSFCRPHRPPSAPTCRIRRPVHTKGRWRLWQPVRSEPASAPLSLCHSTDPAFTASDTRATYTVASISE